MNKNWFYRVLALALVAMLAVPMFAFAEEDVLATAAEAPAEELATALEGEDEIEPKVTLVGTNIVEVALGMKVPTYIGKFDINEDTYIQIDLTNANGKKENFKSSNRKVATVSPTGVVFFVGVGTATITCTGYVDGYKKPLTSKIVLDVIDPTEPSYLTGYLWTDDPTLVPNMETADFSDVGEDVIDDKVEVHVFPGEGIAVQDTPVIHYRPLPFNSYHEYIGPNNTTATTASYPVDYMHGYSYKWSNSKVAFFDGNNHLGFRLATTTADGSPVNGPFVASSKFWQGGYVMGNATQFDYDLMPIFYKPGKSTLTIKTQATAGLKSKSYTNTFVVEKSKVGLSLGSDKDMQKKADIAGEVLFQLGSIDIQSMDKVVLTIKLYNGTDWSFPLSGLTMQLSATDSNITASPFLQYNVDADSNGDTYTNNAVKGSAKAHKTSTITVTFQNKRNSGFNIKSVSANNPATVGTDYKVFSRRDAEEILAPYPNVWDPSFSLSVDTFNFVVSPRFGGTITPVPAWP